MQKLIVALLLCFLVKVSFSQIDSSNFFKPSTQFNGGKLAVSTSVFGVGYVGSIVGLSQVWYADYNTGKFHFFNDNDEWLQMDKVGHLVTAYQLGYYSTRLNEWTGMKKNNALLYGVGFSFLYLTSIEALDGFSNGWGASVGDITANTVGVMVLFTQEKWLKDRFVDLKFSSHFSEYAKYRPNLLGNSWNERLIKDYNGQTYWLTLNLGDVFAKENKAMDKLGLAFGYSVNGLTGARANVTQSEGFTGELPLNSERKRQYYISLDVDLKRIKTKSVFVNSVLHSFGFVKFPFPAVQMDRNGVVFRPIYF